MTSGEQIRDFIHVDEVSKELIRACERNDLIPGKAIVKNIASGKPMKLIDFALMNTDLNRVVISRKKIFLSLVSWEILLLRVLP